MFFLASAEKQKSPEKTVFSALILDFRSTNQSLKNICNRIEILHSHSKSAKILFPSAGKEEQRLESTTNQLPISYEPVGYLLITCLPLHYY